MRPTLPQLVREYTDARRAGRYDAALTLIEQALEMAPKNPQLHIDKSSVLLSLGRTDEARRAAHRATVLGPLLPHAHAALGLVFLSQRKFNDAENNFERALALDRRNVRALEGFCTLRLGQQRLGEAERFAASAIRAAPGDARLYVLLGDVFAAAGNSAGMVESYRRARDLDMTNPEALSKYVAAREAVGGLDAARQVLEEAVTRSPDSAVAHQALGEFLSDNGFLDEAVVSLRRAIALDPARTYPVRLLTVSKKFADRDDPDFRLVEKAYAEAAPESAARAEMAFALGKAFDDLRDHEAALDAYLEANRLKRADKPFSMEREEKLFAGLESAFSEKRIGKLAGTGHASRRPIFVVGMPRSGTTLTETLLARGPGVYPAGELQFLGMAANASVGVNPTIDPVSFMSRLTPAQLSRIGEDYLSRLEPKAAAAPRFTDKLPHNFRLIGLIHLVLPNAKIVHVRRDPLDTCLSMLKVDFRAEGLGFTNDLVSLGRYYNLYRGLMRHWRRVLPNAFYEIGYEDLVSSPQDSTRALFDYCELEWTPAVLDIERNRREVKTASVAQVRQAINRNSVRSGDRYGTRLDPLRAALAEWQDKPA